MTTISQERHVLVPLHENSSRLQVGALGGREARGRQHASRRCRPSARWRGACCLEIVLCSVARSRNGATGLRDRYARCSHRPHVGLGVCGGGVSAAVTDVRTHASTNEIANQLRAAKAINCKPQLRLSTQSASCGTAVGGTQTYRCKCFSVTGIAETSCACSKLIGA